MTVWYLYKSKQECFLRADSLCIKSRKVLCLLCISNVYYQVLFKHKQACSRRCTKCMYVFGYVLQCSLKSVSRSSPKFRTHNNFVLTLGHHLPFPKTILRLKKSRFCGYLDSRIRQLIFSKVPAFLTNFKILIRKGVCHLFYHELLF